MHDIPRTPRTYSSISHTSSSWTVKDIFDMDWMGEVRVSMGGLEILGKDDSKEWREGHGYSWKEGVK